MWKKNHPHQCRWPSSKTQEVTITKMRKGNFALLELKGPSSACGHGCPWFSDLGTWTGRHLAFPSLLSADGRQWGFSASMIPWANSCDKSPHICTCRFYCFSGEWLIQQFKAKEHRGTPVVVQWLRPCLPMQGVWVWSLVRALRSKPPGRKTKTLKKKKKSRSNTVTNQ